MSEPETTRLEHDEARASNWKRWGPYLSERQWATVREDYSADGDAWGYFPHEHARSRAYRWGEDGLLGFCDRQSRLHFALALWNGRDPFLKERLFGLTGPEGNHGEDVKEAYYYLDATPTYSYAKARYKYPQAEFPYARLVAENAKRSRNDREFELEDTGVFDEGRYFDVTAEYAKAGPNDILVKVTVANRGPEAATLHVLPTLWFRNTWSWGAKGEEDWGRPSLSRTGATAIAAEHASLGRCRLEIDAKGAAGAPELLFTENESNRERLWGVRNETPFVKDAFHEYVVRGRADAVNRGDTGTKAAAHFVLNVPAGAEVVLRFRLFDEREAPATPFGDEFEAVFRDRIAEADAFYAARLSADLAGEARDVARAAYAGLLWSKQFYCYPVREWLDGDPGQPAPPAARKEGRNAQWRWLHARDVLSMPDKWEYPWFAAWDLGFHAAGFARVDPAFAKEQLILLLREWYMHPNGQLPAYEWALGDVNPPVHAWAAWSVYQTAAERGARDRAFLARVFQKLLLNFTWWVNRKDKEGDNLFSGGFLGLDNVGVFDRSRPLPVAGSLAQADGTAWMAFYCATMLEIALELAVEDPIYEDMASKFFEHFVAISEAMNTLGGSGLWDEGDGFYYDQLVPDEGPALPLRVRSLVGIVPLYAVTVLDDATCTRLPGFAKRLNWFLANRPELSRHIAYATGEHGARDGHRLLAIPTRERLERVLRYVLDEREFLSPHGVRSLSRVHAERPYVFRADDGERFAVRYVPGESDSALFGGNSNWRGPVWVPMNYLLIEALERYHRFYGEKLRVECPTGSGRWLTLHEVAQEIARRVGSLFLRDARGERPCDGGQARYATDPHFRDLVLFHEYFDGDTGRGCGASHQTGWTALVARLLERRGG